MKVWVLKFHLWNEKNDPMSIQLFASQHSALRAFEDDGMVDGNRDKDFMIRQLFLGYSVDIDNQSTVTLEQMDVAD